MSMSSCANSLKVSEGDECLIVDEPMLFDDEVDFLELSLNLKKQILIKNLDYCSNYYHCDSYYQPYCDNL